ncbi:MAG: hypothetical protein LVQ95_01410 [Candidatus Micrarchaeales archaeon]|nr:hypothetical protein [Candidatus Micrarchaeales archaeon]
MKIRNQSFAASANKYMRIALSILMVFGTLGMPVFAATTSYIPGPSNSANSVICNTYFLYSTIDTAIFIVGLVLMLLGGAMYAGSHMMPGQSKGTMQGYGMGMVLGGVIGVVIAVVAPFLFSAISGQNISGYTYTPTGGLNNHGYITAPNVINPSSATGMIQYSC